ncbi:hypothetical protein [Frankia sp. ACN1ag]|uniref:hypothetical protein n=1 Tax=Frankia sp. ACN1ag TaxID=102891 RepID=UPI000A99ABB4|nr:hypothetical protein [Frankia sp. ACN1ag]
MSTSEILAGVAPEQVDDARRLQENLDRRLRDQQLRDELAAADFAGPRYEMFETELARYGMSVQRAWMYTGYIFALATSRGFALHPTDAELDELRRDSDAREELANMTVAVALPRFHARALLGGGWRPDGGASLATYFMGACLYVFPTEFRKRRAAHRRWTRAHLVEARNLNRYPVDPVAYTLSATSVAEDLLRINSRAREIVALTIDGYSQEEIVEILHEPSVRAVEGVLHRWRTQEKKRRGQEGGPQL